MPPYVGMARKQNGGYHGSISVQLASTAATDVGMHGLLASQSCYHSVLPPSLCTLWTSSRFLHY